MAQTKFIKNVETGGVFELNVDEADALVKRSPSTYQYQDDRLLDERSDEVDNASEATALDTPVAVAKPTSNKRKSK